MTAVGHNLTFTDRHGNRRSGAVWSAGPDMATWWVILVEPDHTPSRRFVLVKVLRGVGAEVNPK